MASAPVRDIEQHIEALREFKRKYAAYLGGGHGGPAELRREVIRTIPAAQEAIDQVGGGLVVGDPPAAGGRTRYHGLQNIAFLHEQPGFRLSEPPLYEAVLDSVYQAEAQLEHQAARGDQDTAGAETEGKRAASGSVFCRRGHFMGQDGNEDRFCVDCGAAAVLGCPNCDSTTPVVDDKSCEPAGFCPVCGGAFPWVSRRGRIYQLENLLAREDLGEATELAVREQLEALADPDLSAAEQRDRWGHVRKLAPGLWQSGRTIIEGLASAAIRSQVGL